MARLHHENIRPADVLQDLEINLAITEPPQQRFAERNV